MIYLNQVLSISNEVSCFQLCFCILIPFTKNFFDLKCIFALYNQPNQALNNSNVLWHLQTIQNKLFSTQMSLSTPNTLQSSFLNANDFKTPKNVKLHLTNTNEVFVDSNDLNTFKFAQFHSTTSTRVLFSSNDLNIFKCVQLHSTTSSLVIVKSNDFNTFKYKQCYSTTLIWVYLTQMTLISQNVYNCTQQPQIKSYSTLITLISSNVHNCNQQPQIKSISTQMILLPSNVCNQISNSKICMRGLITYQSTIELDIRSHNKIHIHKGI